MKRRRVILVPLAVVVGALLACQPTPAPKTPLPTVTPAPAPVLPPIPTRPPEPAASRTPLAAEGFEASVEGWNGWATEGTSSEATWDPAGQLLWSVELAPEKAVALVRQWPALAGADGLTIRLTSLDRSAMLVLGVQEADGSNYNLVLPLEAGKVAEDTLAFEGFGLDRDSEDENDQLDTGQLTMLSLVDISGFVSAPRPNRVAIDEIVLWAGTLDPLDLACAAPGPAAPNEDFRVGVDANFVPQGERNGYGFWAGEQRVDPLGLFAANGANAFRVRLWVGEEGESKLEYATDLALRAQRTGLRPYLVIFLTEEWADVNKQPAPGAWADLTLDERASAVRRYARETAQHFHDQGVEIDFYEIGNEIDYGICGVYADATHPRDAASLRSEIWPDEARLVQAAIEGVREANPGARFTLHIATGWDPGFAAAFFLAMADLGVEYDYVGLSYYPSSFGAPVATRFCDTLDRLSEEVGKPIVIAETAYPAEPPTGGLFGDWRRPLPGYPLTPEGQAWWVTDLLAGMRERGDVLGIYVFSPGFWFSGELWGPFALFDGEGKARPAVSSFQPPPISRLSTIPPDAVKMEPADDPWPLAVGPGWSKPVPLGAPVNTAGAEDSPFVTLDGQTFYFFFTPDVRIPAEKQLFDGVTGIWATRRAGKGWTEPERVILADPGELHLDGCLFVLDDWMVFCSVRQGGLREIDLYTATLRDGVWTDWQNWGEPFNGAYDVGEMHVTADGRFLYFGSKRPGGLGGSDLWVSQKTGDTWSEPVNLGPPVNTPGDENRPFVSADGQELWYDSTSRQGRPGPAVFRSVRQPDGSWGVPEEVVSTFAGEPTLTGDGRTLYFTHHYFSADLGQMIEADIYVATRVED